MTNYFGNEWIKADKKWNDYPLGTKARESWRGGYWIKTKLGWKASVGDTFPIPAASDQVCLPKE